MPARVPARIDQPPANDLDLLRQHPEPIPRVVLSWGLGVDSTAVLTRWLLDPASRDFGLDEFVVITAMVGSEWALTGTLAERHVLPLLARHRVRLLAVARRGPSRRDGVAVLTDSRRPWDLPLSGAYTLEDNMLTAGTIPQSGGDRICSQNFKGWPLDQAIATITAGRPYRHVLGYEAGERGRAERDTRYNTGIRTGEYPLLAWDWNRTDCATYLADIYGVTWPKSACCFCPYALQNTTSRQRVLTQFTADPATAYRALLMEHVALALNPRQGLLGGKRLIDLITSQTTQLPELRHVLDHFHTRIRDEHWALYDVRRAWRPTEHDPDKIAAAPRAVTRIADATRDAVLDRLHDYAAANRLAIEHDGHHTRAWHRRRTPGLPAAEHLITTAPATVADKIGSGFSTAWRLATAEREAA